MNVAVAGPARGRTRAVQIAVALLMLCHGAVEAQTPRRFFSCGYWYSYADKLLIVSRDIAEITSLNTTQQDRYVGNQVADRVESLFTKGDLLANGGDRGVVKGQVDATVRLTQADAEKVCLETIRKFRREGFAVLGYEPAYIADEKDVKVVSHRYLSPLEYPDYEPGTIAANARSSKDTDRRDNSRSVNEWGRTPEQELEFQRALVESQRKMTAQADSLFDAGEFESARKLYAIIAGPGGLPAFQPHAAEQLQRCDEKLEARSKAQVAHFLGLGANFGQSYFQRDGGTVAVTFTQETFGLPMFYGIGTSFDVLSRAISTDTTSSLAPDAREFTRYYLQVGTSLPFLQVGDFGVHVGYIYQQTDRRGLNLGMAGIHWGQPGSSMLRLDVVPVFGKYTLMGGITFTAFRD